MTNYEEETSDGTLLPVPVSATIPDGVDAQEASEIKRKAVQVVAQLREASGSKELEVIDAITAVGMQSQRQAGRDLDLLRVHVGDMMGREGSNASDALGEKCAAWSSGWACETDDRMLPFAGLVTEFCVVVLTLKPSEARQSSSRPPRVSLNIGAKRQASCAHSASVRVAPIPLL